VSRGRHRGLISLIPPIPPISLFSYKFTKKGRWRPDFPGFLNGIIIRSVLPYVETSIIVAEEPKKVYRFACNMELYPRYMKDVESVTVLERKENQTITDWETSVEGTPIYWKEIDYFDDENLTITYELIEGDLDKFEGQWHFKSVPGGTEITLGVDFDFGIPALEELIGPTLKVKVKENSMMMLEGIKEEMEKGPGVKE
jgi:coenzyme Q-binding protein COQ10